MKATAAPDRCNTDSIVVIANRMNKREAILYHSPPSLQKKTFSSNKIYVYDLSK